MQTPSLDAPSTIAQASHDKSHTVSQQTPSTQKPLPQSASSNVIEVAVPLKALGLHPRDGLRTKLDWGVLTTDDGNSVRQRLYWTNSVASGTTDDSLEARLEPHLWGDVLFSSKSSDVDLLDRAVKSKPASPAAELLDELNKKK